jgi:two-component system, NtrC family, response regulator GlrR
MGRSLFVIEHAEAALLPAWINQLQPPDLVITRRIHWDKFCPELLVSCQEHAIVANTAPQACDATQMFQWLQQHPIHVPILVILPAGNDELVRLAASSADDFLILPVHPEEFRQRLMRLLGPPAGFHDQLNEELIGELGLRQAVGAAPPFLDALEKVVRFGANSAPILLTGETGTGKELFARLLHVMSPRRRGPFIPVECGAIPEHLFENELFGHAKGAFTGAHCEQKGCAGLAHGGTLFLDEIDCLSHATQGKLLRLLQENKFRPLGAECFRDANVRVIAASNRDLSRLVDAKAFRQDLFFRLDVLRIHLPALRERQQDVPLLARHFVNACCDANNLRKKFLTPSALLKLESHYWPGNIRELYNTIQRAVLMCPGPEIASLHVEIRPDATEVDGRSATFQSAKAAAIERFEREFVQRLLERHGGNVSRAAREAQKDRRAFGRLAKKYGLKLPPA